MVGSSVSLVRWTWCDGVSSGKPESHEWSSLRKMQGLWKFWKRELVENKELAPERHLSTVSQMRSARSTPTIPSQLGMVVADAAVRSCSPCRGSLADPRTVWFPVGQTLSLCNLHPTSKQYWTILT